MVLNIDICNIQSKENIAASYHGNIASKLLNMYVHQLPNLLVDGLSLRWLGYRMMKMDSLDGCERGK